MTTAHRCARAIAEVAYKRRHHELFAALAYAALRFAEDGTAENAIELRTRAKRLHRHECRYPRLEPCWLNERECDLWNGAMVYAAYGIGRALRDAAREFANPLQ